MYTVRNVILATVIINYNFTPTKAEIQIFKIHKEDVELQNLQKQWCNKLNHPPEKFTI